jgi:hypothetical protein
MAVEKASHRHVLALLAASFFPWENHLPLAAPPTTML